MIQLLNNVYTTVEVARMVGLSEGTIRIAIKKDKLDAYQLRNKQFLIDEKAIKAFQEIRQKKTTS